MTKRILGLTIAVVLVLGLAGAAYAATSADRPSAGLADAALALAADPQPGAPAPGKREELRACVKPKVDAGTDRKAAVRECAAQLGLPAKPARPGGKTKGFGLGQAAHAEVVVPKRGEEGQWETVVVDRGAVTTASADSLTLRRPDGPTVTVKVVAGTKVRGAATVAGLAAGREVVVVSARGEARSVVARR